MSYSEEKRVMMDVSGIREAYDSPEIDNIAWIRSCYNPQDAMTKLTTNAILLRSLKCNQVEYPIKNWIVRAHSYEECFRQFARSP